MISHLSMNCVAENKGQQSQQWKTNKQVSLELKWLTFGDGESDICGWEGLYKQLHMDEIELISTQTSNITYIHILMQLPITLKFMINVGELPFCLLLSVLSMWHRKYYLY